MFLWPCATTNRRIVGISYGRKNCADALKKTQRRHRADGGQCTLFEVIHTESIVHPDNDPLLSDEGHVYSPPRTIFFSLDGIKGRASICAMKHKALTRVLHYRGTVQLSLRQKNWRIVDVFGRGNTMKNRDLQAAWTYHNSTKHSYQSIRTNRHYLDWENQPIPFKIYSELEPIPLPQQLSSAGMKALEAISTFDISARDQAIPSIQTVAEILFLSAGITKRRSYPGGEILFRAAACTGQLYHIDLYLICGDLPELQAGVYHFGPHDFALRRLRAGDYRGVLVQASGREPAMTAAPVIIVCASTYWRNAWKYQSRTYRHCYWDAGTILANLLAAVAARHTAARIVLGFADQTVSRLLGLDTMREGALALVALGTTPDQINEAPSIEAISFETEPLSKTEVD